MTRLIAILLVLQTATALFGSEPVAKFQFPVAKFQFPVIPGATFDIPWWISTRVRELEERQSFLTERIGSLPPYSLQTNTGTGFHSESSGRADAVKWVQVDLGREYPISRIVLVPASVQSGNALVEGYGFPVRFRVQASNDPTFATSLFISDHSQDDYSNPGKYAHQIRDVETRARYVRVTVTRSATGDNGAFFALGELIVLSGNRNVAVWRPVTSSGSFEAEMSWSREYLVDGISILPLPMGVYASKTDGYLSSPWDAQTGTKWVQIDLGEEFVIDEIRLVPARPPGQADVPGWGFPFSFKIELAHEANFSDVETFCDFQQLRHWSDRALILPSELRPALSRVGRNRIWTPDPEGFPADPPTARYVRLAATAPDPRISSGYVALAEFQIYAGNINVARDATVTASGNAFRNPGARWAPDYLIDDYTSRTTLLEYPIWLDQLEERRHMQRELTRVTHDVAAVVEEIWWNLGSAGSGLVFLWITLLTWRNWTQRRQLSRQTEHLRNQIASDLHDDIGSNLGTIALLCQTIGSRDIVSEEMARELKEIREVALETGDSMRDIVWLIRSTTTTLDEFIGRVRATAGKLLPHVRLEFQIPEHVPATIVTLNWRRNMFLSIKETLYNAARHGQPSCVTIAFEFPGNQLQVTLSDNGTGFDPQNRREGFGIANVTKRLAQLGGEASYHSEPGSGTRVTLTAPFTRLRYSRLNLRRYSRWLRDVLLRRKQASGLA